MRKEKRGHEKANPEKARACQVQNFSPIEALSLTMRRARKKQRRRELELEREPEAIDTGFIEAVTLLAWQIMYRFHFTRRQSLVSCVCMHCRSVDLLLQKVVPRYDTW